MQAWYPVPKTLLASARMSGFSTRIVTLFAASILLLAGGCESPYGNEDDDERLATVLEAAASREMVGLESDPGLETVPVMDSEVERSLAARRSELDQLGPPAPRLGVKLDLGEDLLGQKQEEVALSLGDAIRTAVENNLLVQGARLTQGISETQITQAQAAFDSVLFSNFQFQRLEQPQVVPFIAGVQPVSTPVRNSKEWGITTGLRNQLVSGGALEVSTTIGYNDIADDNDLQFRPDPAWSTAVTLGVTQPLLRGFGSDVALAELRLARNEARASTEDLRAQLLSVVENVEMAYWQLVLARQRLASAQWLLNVGIEVRDVLSRRRELDVTEANYADAVATVERRRGDLIIAQRDVRRASDVLKVVMNAPDLPVGEETLVVPADWMSDQPLRYNLREAIAIAIDRSPNIRKALLLIDDASIGIVVADNGRLPQLDLEGQVRWNGLESSLGTSYSDIVDRGFVDYLLGMQFSQAIGNQAAEAVYRRARLRRSSALVAYQRSIQDTVLAVKNALRDVRSNALLIGQNRALRLAEAENLRALLVDERTKGALTPEFLALKFQRQDGLANAQIREAQALVDYNTAIARLFAAMGIGLQMNRIELRIDDGSRSLESASESTVGREQS